MPKVNRSDPCPCGSGKKYKNCCMRQDRVSASQELSIAPEEGYLLNALLSYAQSAQFAADFDNAFAFYWGGNYDLSGLNESATEDVRRTFLWFIHDYHTRADHRRPIDLFIETQTASLSPESRKLLAAWARSTIGAFRILDIGGDARLRLFDLFRQQELEASDAVLARNAQRGDLAIGRLYEMDSVLRFSHLTLLLPTEFEPGVTEYVTNAYNLYRDDHPAATWDDFLRENGHIVHAYLLSGKAASLRALIGPGTRYHEPAVTRDKLQESTLARVKELQQQQIQAQAAQRETPVRRTTSGIVLPGAAPAEPSAEPEKPAAAPKILLPGRDF